MNDISIKPIKNWIKDRLTIKALIRDVFILFLVIPLVLTLLLYLPATWRKVMVFNRDSPTLLSHFTTNFIHSDFKHLSENLLWYFIITPQLYLFNLASHNKRRFYIFLVFAFLILPWLLAGVRTSIEWGSKKEMGFSGITLAFLGFLPYSVFNFLREKGLDLEIIGLLGGMMVLTFLTFCLTYSEQISNLIGPFQLKLYLSFTAVSVLLFYLGSRNIDLDNLYKLREDLTKAYFHFILPLCMLLLTYFVGINLALPNELTGKIGIPVHLSGIFFSIVFSLLLELTSKEIKNQIKTSLRNLL